MLMRPAYSNHLRTNEYEILMDWLHQAVYRQESQRERAPPMGLFALQLYKPVAEIEPNLN